MAELNKIEKKEELEKAEKDLAANSVVPNIQLVSKTMIPNKCNICGYVNEAGVAICKKCSNYLY